MKRRSRMARLGKMAQPALMELSGKLTVIVDRATYIIDPSLQGRGNSFCALRVGNQVFSTAVVEGGSSSPIFKSEFEFEIDQTTNDLAISVYSRDINTGDQMIGSNTLIFNEVLSQRHKVPLTAFSLWLSRGKYGGHINISLTYQQDIYCTLHEAYEGLGRRKRENPWSIREPTSLVKDEGFQAGHSVGSVTGKPLFGQASPKPMPKPVIPHPPQVAQSGVSNVDDDYIMDPYPGESFVSAHHLEDKKALEDMSFQPWALRAQLDEITEDLQYMATQDPILAPRIEELREHLIKEFDVARRAEDLWKSYIQCGDGLGMFESMIHMGRGKLSAALFPGAFRRHLAASMLASKTLSTFENLDQHLKNAINFLLKDLLYAKIEKNNLQTDAFEFRFIDEACHGEPVNIDAIFRLRELVAIFQQFLPDSETSIEYCIVQHDVTRVYLCRRVERSAFNEDSVMEKAIGVLGLETTGDDILVENVRHDGSYYSGNLEDFSYKFVPNKNGDVGQAVDNQCANRLFCHRKGAEFLAGNENGLKCSPLLAIALAIAIDRKNLALEWNMTHGHMDIKNLSPVGFENAKWQILYMHNINELGFAVEWGMEQLGSIEASSSSPAQSRTSRSQLAEDSAVLEAAAAQKTAWGVNVSLFGFGLGINSERRGSKGKELAKASHARIIERLLCRSSGRFVETENLDTKHAYVKEYLLQGRLSELPNKYLVVGDNVNINHVSVYWADDEQKYAWITGIMLPDAKSTLFKGKGRCLKGLRMEVERDCSKFVTTDVSKSTSDLMSRFKQHKKLDIVGGNMIYVPPCSQSNDEWVHLIGHHEEFSGNNFLWEATHMMAIISSRTSFSSGALLEMFVLKDMIGAIGYTWQN